MGEKYGFEDIIDSHRGIFGTDTSGVASGSAIEAFEKPEQKATPDGMVYEVICENGHPKQLNVEWPEFIAIGNMISPHIAYQGTNILKGPVAWGFDLPTQKWFPDTKCSYCGWQHRLMIPIHEIKAAIQQAISSGFMSDETARKLAQICFTMKQRMQQSGG